MDHNSSTPAARRSLKWAIAAGLVVLAIGGGLAWRQRSPATPTTEAASNPLQPQALQSEPPVITNATAGSLTFVDFQQQKTHALIRAVSQNSKYALIDWDGLELFVVEVETGSVTRKTYIGELGADRDPAFLSEDGSLAALAGSGGVVRFWDSQGIESTRCPGLSDPRVVGFDTSANQIVVSGTTNTKNSQNAVGCLFDSATRKMIERDTAASGSELQLTKNKTLIERTRDTQISADNPPRPAWMTDDYNFWLLVANRYLAKTTDGWLWLDQNGKQLARLADIQEPVPSLLGKPAKAVCLGGSADQFSDRADDLLVTLQQGDAPVIVPGPTDGSIAMPIPKLDETGACPPLKQIARLTKTNVELIDLVTGAVSRAAVPSGSRNQRTVQFLANGELAVVAWPEVVVFDGAGKNPKTMTLVPNDSKKFGDDNVGSVSPDGSLVAVEGLTTISIFSLNDGKEVGSLPIRPGYLGADKISWSDQGSLLTYTWTFSQFSFAHVAS